MNNDIDIETRQSRREKRLQKKKSRMPKHAKNLIKIYRDALIKRFTRKENSKKL